jgi:alpha-glucosidase
VGSPDGKVQFEMLRRGQPRLTYRATFSGRAVIEPSSLGIVIDGVDLTEGAKIENIERYRMKETYPWHGVHSEAVNDCRGAKISLRRVKSKTNYTLEVRAFDDGVAFRFIVPGEGSRVPDEASAFVIPAGSVVWYHDFEGHYEGVHAKKEISEVPPGDWAAPPVTIQLPEGLGYAAITEAGLFNYAGMALQADGNRTFRARLGHVAPVSYPFRLRYAAEIEQRARPAAISGTITTPWRVVMIGRDLNTLVNSDIIPNLAPPPDKSLFPDGCRTEWVKPGRSVWKYLDGGESTLEEMKEFSRLAGELGFEYNLVEGFWQRWSPEELQQLVDTSRKYNVRIWLWKHSRDLRGPEAHRIFFQLCRRHHIAGVKLDFYDHEAKEVVELYETALHEATQFKLMVNFHGANKPTGEARTWPNEMTREGVYGLENRRMEAWARHNTTLPFTRYLAGHADYTPVIFGERRRETSWAHQIATAVVFTSPLLVYGAHPKSLLENPAVEMIKSIPSVWDETAVLPVSKIGEIAAFARRQGDRWFLAMLNGPSARVARISLSFLGRGHWEALLVQDREDDAAAVRIENTTASPDDELVIVMRSGGGFVGRFSPARE